MFICKICGNQVEAGQAFCGKCGADVVDNYETVCPTCNTKNGAGSRYCAKCGGILSVLKKPICAVCGNKNLPGAKFCITCGAPILASSETHADSDILDVRSVKQKLDMMERERMQSVDREIAVKRKRVLEERARIMQEVDAEKKKNDAEFKRLKTQVDSYRAKLNEFGSEDLNQLKKISSALKNYASYYADPYTELDDEKIANESYICPSCGNINPLEAAVCMHCGRGKARATLLLSKGKIKQSPPIKRKKDVIAAPEQDTSAKHTPTFDEYVANENAERADSPKSEGKPVEEKAANFSGGNQNFGYPYPPYGYPPMGGGMMGGFGAPGFYNQQTGEPYQMPPILQPIAFVPYLTQEQPLMQYSPTDVEQPVQAAWRAPQPNSADTASQFQTIKQNADKTGQTTRKTGQQFQDGKNGKI